MSKSFSQDLSLDCIYKKSHKQTKLANFLSRITPSIFEEMKKYLKRNKISYLAKTNGLQKILLYEDIYIIVTFKQRETDIFINTTLMKNSLQEIALQTQRSICTIEQRIKKKLCQLTMEQLTYAINSNKDLTFGRNTKILNTDNWPQFLKIPYKKNPLASEYSNPINVDSDKNIQPNLVSDKKQKVNVTMRQYKQKKLNAFQGMLQIMNEPNGEDQVSIYQHQYSFKQSDPQNYQKQQKLNDYDFSSPSQRGQFAASAIEIWKNNNLENYLQKEQKYIQADIQIVYNSKKLMFMMLNPKIIKSISDHIALERQVHEQKIHAQQIAKIYKKIPVQSKKSIFHEKITYPQAIQIQKQDASKVRTNKFYDDKKQIDQLLIQTQTYQVSTPLKSKGSQRDQFRFSGEPIQIDVDSDANLGVQIGSDGSNENFSQMVIQKEGNLQSEISNDYFYQQNQNYPHFQELFDEILSDKSQQSLDVKQKAKNLIQLMENILEGTDLQRLPEDALQLLKQGQKLMDKTKTVLQKETQEEKKVQSKKHAQNKYFTKESRRKKTKKTQFIDLISPQSSSFQDDSKERQMTSEEPMNDSYTKKILYWFNNDPVDYAQYQDDPYKNGYLMWSEKEDEILKKVNRDFYKYCDDLDKLINLKSAEMVKKRIDFISLKMNPLLTFYYKSIMKR